jgi:hypothetical protein
MLLTMRKLPKRMWFGDRLRANGCSPGFVMIEKVGAEIQQGYFRPFLFTKSSK